MPPRNTTVRIGATGSGWGQKTDYLLDIDPDFFDEDGNALAEDDPRAIIVRWDSGYGYTLTGRLDYLEALS